MVARIWDVLLMMVMTPISGGLSEMFTKDFVRLGAAKVIIASRRLEELQRV